jgi:hypothetical protein
MRDADDDVRRFLGVVVGLLAVYPVTSGEAGRAEAGASLRQAARAAVKNLFTYFAAAVRLLGEARPGVRMAFKSVIGYPPESGLSL